MTRRYALEKLLEHGPLRFKEMVEITGWPVHGVWNAVSALINAGRVNYIGIKVRREYSLWK